MDQKSLGEICLRAKFRGRSFPVLVPFQKNKDFNLRVFGLGIELQLREVEEGVH